MANNREYFEKVELTRGELLDSFEAQRNIRKEGYINQNEQTLVNSLTAFAGVLFMVFILPTPITLGAGVIASLGGLLPSELEEVKTRSIAGEDLFYDWYEILRDNPSYEAVELDVAFLEFVDEGYRISFGGSAARIKTANGYIYA